MFEKMIFCTYYLFKLETSLMTMYNPAKTPNKEKTIVIQGVSSCNFESKYLPKYTPPTIKTSICIPIEENLAKAFTLFNFGFLFFFIR